MRKKMIRVLCTILSIIMVCATGLSSYAAQDVTKTFKDKQKINQTIELFKTPLGIYYMMNYGTKRNNNVDMGKFRIAVSAYQAGKYRIVVSDMGDATTYKVKTSNVSKVSKKLFGKKASKFTKLKSQYMSATYRPPTQKHQEVVTFWVSY